MSGIANILDGKTPQQIKHVLAKTAYLSYYISMYKTMSENIGYENSLVTVDEIYDFLCDIKYELGDHVPDINKNDISFCFSVLQMVGVCKRN
jgi:hypothetical protein